MTIDNMLKVTSAQEVKDTSNAVLHRIFSEVIALKDKPVNSEWFDTSTHYFNFFNDIEIGFGLAKATLLTIIKDNWEELPLYVRKQFGYSFHNFAFNKTGKERSTYEAYILTARIWILEEFGKGRTVRIHDRASDGRPIIENGKQSFIDKPFIPYNVSLSKLNICNPQARLGTMTDKLWEMLVDDFYTCEDIRVEASKDKDGNPHKYTYRYYTEGPLLCIARDSEIAILGELNWEEYETNPLVQEGIGNLLRYFKIQMDEDVINNIIHQGYITP